MMAKPVDPAVAQPFSRTRAFVLLLVVGATGVAAALIAGSSVLDVLATWRYLLLAVFFLVPAGMVGLALTGAAQRAGVFEGSPWPAGFRLAVGVSLGAGVLAFGTLVMGSFHLLEPAWWSVVALGVCAAAGFSETRRFLRDQATLRPLREAASAGVWWVVLAGIPMAALLIGACFPPSALWRSELRGFDVMEYHLEIPREYAAANSTAPLAHNVYSLFPANVEMLYLLETQFARTITGSDSYLAGVFPAQFLHALLMLLTAAGLALAPLRVLRGGFARATAGVVFLAIPWTIVTGSLAYNEGGMLLAGTLALVLALTLVPGMAAARDRAGRRQAVILIGVLLGIAAGCKLTAALFFGVPVAAVLLLAGGGARWREAAVVTLLALAAYGPWAVRAAVYSGGNPFFPIASTVLPRGPWTAEMAARFAAGHSAPAGERSVGARLGALGRESVLDAQWSPGVASAAEWSAALAGRALPEVDSFAGWERVGPLWPLLLVAVVVVILAGRGAGEGGGAAWRAGLLLLMTLGLQVGAWLAFTHLQARFLLPIAVPMALLVGVAVTVGSPGWRVVAGALVAVQAVATGLLLLPEAGLFLGPNGPANVPAAQLPAAAMGDIAGRQINLDAFIPEQFHPDPQHPRPVLLVGSSTALLLANPVVYATVFDENPLGDALRSGGPAGAVAWMQKAGIRWVWVDTQEIERLRDSYGFDAAIGKGIVGQLESAGCRPIPIDLPPNVTLLAVPAG